MTDVYLDEYPLLLIFLASIIIILVASEVGRCLGVRAAAQGRENVSTLVGAIFGLLALMIGFTFAMALTRFEARRDAVLNEANAIETTALRASLLPDPHNAEALKLLREYVEIRVNLARHLPSLAEVNAGIARSNTLQKALWQQAIAAREKDDSSARFFIEPLNHMIDSQRKRVSAIRSQVPNEVLIALYGVAAMAGAFAGYAAGLGTRTSRLPVYLMGLVVCSVILLIEDIDTPFSGFIAISQQPLIDTAVSLEAVSGQANSRD
jgi:hypothetical protein